MKKQIAVYAVLCAAIAGILAVASTSPAAALPVADECGFMQLTHVEAHDFQGWGDYLVSLGWEAHPNAASYEVRLVPDGNWAEAQFFRPGAGARWFTLAANTFKAGVTYDVIIVAFDAAGAELCYTPNQLDPLDLAAWEPPNGPQYCFWDWAGCETDWECCSGICSFGSCVHCRWEWDTCDNDIECCSGVCSYGACTACRSEWEGCDDDIECCSGICSYGACATCRSEWDECEADIECCSGICSYGACATCRAAWDECTANKECCSGICSDGACVEVTCRANGNQCTTARQCCSGLCSSGFCRPQLIEVDR